MVTYASKNVEVGLHCHYSTLNTTRVTHILSPLCDNTSLVALLQTVFERHMPIIDISSWMANSAMSGVFARLSIVGHTYGIWTVVGWSLVLIATIKLIRDVFWTPLRYMYHYAAQGGA